MNTRLMKTKGIIFLSIFLIFLFPKLSVGEGESFRSLLNNALKFYIEQNYEKVVESLDKANIMMRNLAPLKVEALLFCKRIDMFAKYETRKSIIFKPGEEFLVYFQPGNYSLAKVEGGWEIDLKEYFEILDETGEVIAKMEDPLEFHTLLFSPLTTGLYFKNIDFVPTRPGKYIFKVILEDLIKGKSITATLPFEVVLTNNK